MDGNFSPNALTPTQELLLQDALEGLSRDQKTLSPKWLYDQRGSEIFEQITVLPEYYPTRTETGILRRYSDVLSGHVPCGGALVELGSGASVKTRLLLDEGRHFGAYVPLDISADFLEATAHDLRAMYPSLDVVPIVADFGTPVLFPKALEDVPKVGFFPGSTIGNLEPALARTLLQRAAAWPGVERFILGADLVKDSATLVSAYDDAQGVTAEFIKNALVRLNTELGADFDLDQFGYRATWDPTLAQIDMCLQSLTDQVATLSGHRFHFRQGETVQVSASRKYTRDTLVDLVTSAGWRLETMLTDQNEHFAVAVLSLKELNETH